MREWPGAHLRIGIGGRHFHDCALLTVKASSTIFVNQRCEFRKSDFPVNSAHRLAAVNHGNRRDCKRRSMIESRHNQDVPATIRYSPDTYLRRFDARQGLGIAQRIAVILDLTPRIDMLAWLSCAFTKITIVKAKCRATDRVKALGVVRHDDFFGIAPAAGHNY